MIDLTMTGAGRKAASCDARPVHEDAAAWRLGEGRHPGGVVRSERAVSADGSRHGSAVGGVPAGFAELARGPAPDSRVAAERALLEWRRIEQCLAPIIGYGGVGAIYGQSLAVARAEFAWLPAAHEPGPGRTGWAPLYQALAGQPGPESSAADAALQQAFRHLLASLLGGPLARQLLEPRQGVGRTDDARMKETA